MRPKTQAGPVGSPAPQVIPDISTGPAGNGTRTGRESDVSATSPTSQSATGGEDRRGRLRRRAHRTRLHTYAILGVALVAFLIALAVSNTEQVRVSWVFGSSRVPVVWLVLFAAILGWALGLIATAAFHWRTRAPRQGGGTS